MREDQNTVWARRLPSKAWNAVCRAVEASKELTEDEWAVLVDAGLAVGKGVLDQEWSSLARSYLDTPISLRCTASYSGLLYRSSMAIGQANICVLERFRTETQPDGSQQVVAHEDVIEVSATAGHPWTLLLRVIPPLNTLTAPSQQTSGASAKPVVFDETLRARVEALVEEDPNLHIADAAALLEREATGSAREMLNTTDAQVSYMMISAAGDRRLLGAAWYLASADRIYRSTFRQEQPWEEVHPGDLAFTFEWHLMGALDALGIR